MLAANIKKLLKLLTLSYTAQNEIKEHLENAATPKEDQSVNNDFLKEIKILNAEMNRKEALIK